MKTYTWIIFILMLAARVPAVSDTYTLVWADEFSKNGQPDPANWTYEYGHVRNYEAQWYQPENAWCTNGLLIIEARRERVPNTDYDPDSKDWRKKWDHARYTSACLTTEGIHCWQYGRFVMRAKIDTRAGLWPAFWTLGIDGKWPTNGEVDIMEYYQETLLANVIWGSIPYTSAQHKSSKRPLDGFAPDWADEFHIWRMDWDEKNIRIYVDDQLLNEIDIDETKDSANSSLRNPFRQPHYILLNLAVFGSSGGDPDKTEFPARFEIDYVRIYQKNYTM